MTEVLGYRTFAVNGTDWGSGIAYALYEQYPTATRSVHFSMIPFMPLLKDQLTARDITLTPEEQFQERRFAGWNMTGNAYFMVQVTKVLDPTHNATASMANWTPANYNRTRLTG